MARVQRPLPRPIAQASQRRAMSAHPAPSLDRALDAFQAAAGTRPNRTLGSAHPLDVPPGATPPSGSTPYTVVAGDTLGGIAQKNGVTLQQLLDANPQIANPNAISVGQIINIPRPGQGPSATATATATATAPTPTATFAPPVQWAVPTQNQHSITNQQTPNIANQSDRYTCNYASVAMITEFWHAQDPRNPAYTAQDVWDQTAAFTYTPSSGSDGFAILSLLGYGLAYTRSDPILTSPLAAAGKAPLIAELTQLLQTGPVFAAVPCNSYSQIVPGGQYGHSIVITGISSDYNTIYYNDPETGTAQQMTADEYFALAQSPNSYLMTVQPKAPPAG